MVAKLTTNQWGIFEICLLKDRKENLMIMNKYWYYYGNAFKVRFRNHNCYKCGGKLIIIKHRKVVDQKSDESKYYDFNVGDDGAIMKK